MLPLAGWAPSPPVGRGANETSRVAETTERRVRSSLREMKIVPVMMSGGSGTRLWPLSRSGLPKQFVELTGEGTMIQQTALRAARIEGTSPSIVVANQAHVDLVIDQLTEIGQPPRAVIAEPVGRNTAPAVALAAHTLDPDDIMVVLPADAAIRDVDAFLSAIHQAIDLAVGGDLVIFGIEPTRPETGYGYIEADLGDDGVAPVVRFVEKPDADLAADYVESGRFTWNSGMFVFTAAAFLAELELHEPAIARITAAAIDAGLSSGVRIDPDGVFEDCESISIDHAVMERTARAIVVRLDAGWSDVGSWDSLWKMSAPHSASNVVSGRVILSGVSGSLVRGGDRLIAVLGLDDVVIVDTDEALLVVSREHAQEVKSIIDRLPPEMC